MGFALLIICLLGYFISFNIKFRVTYSIAIPVSTALIMSVLYIAALSGVLEITIYAIYIIGAILFFYYMLKQYLNHAPYAHIFSKELLLLLAVIGIYYLRISQAYYIAWDDFTHWGIAVKEIYIYQGLHLPQDATSIYPNHFNYGRIPAIFIYFIIKSIGYSEGHSMFANGLLCLLFSTVVFIPGKIWQSLLLFFGVLAVSALYTPIFRSLYVDGTVGIIFGAIISIYLQEVNKYKAILYILPIVFILPMVKEVGFWLSYAAALTIIIDLVFKRQLKGGILLQVVVLCLMPYISHKLWGAYLANFNVTSPHSNFNIKIFLETLGQAWSSNENQAIFTMFAKSILKFLIQEGSIVIYILFIFSIYLYRKYRPQKEAISNVLWGLCLCLVLYLSLRLFIWLNYFPLTDVLQAASYLRYYANFAIVFVFLAASNIKLILLKIPEEHFKESHKIVVILAIIFISIITTKLYPRPPIYFDHDRQISQKAAQLLYDLKSEGMKVMVVFNNFTQFNCTQLIYEMSPYGKAQELQACRSATINTWPQPYIISKDFVIDKSLFNDKNNLTRDINKYDALYITNLDQPTSEIATSLLHVANAGNGIFVKHNDTFIPGSVHK